MKELLYRTSQLRAEGMAIIEAMKAGGRAPTDEESARLDAIEHDITGLNAAIAHERSLLDAEVASVRDNPEKAPVAGDLASTTPFRSFGAQLAAVARAAKAPHAIDEGLLAIQAVGTGLNEAVDSAGGFLVQTDFTNELLQLAHETGVLIGRTDRRPISANSNGIKINALDEASRVDGSRPARAYWTNEGGTLTGSRPVFRQIEMSLQKLTGLYYATDEELMDVIALEANVAAWFGEEFGFKIDDSLIRGTGAGQPAGVLGHGGTVSVGKETGQAAATILAENVEKMYARMWARSMSRAEWFINQDCWPQLFQLQHSVGTGGVPVFLPPGGISGAPFGALLGRPVVPIEQCETLGTVGDIVFADWSQYIVIEKGGVQAASSIHVEFLTDQTVFRFILRMDGQPKRKVALTPYKGTNTQSSFITLDTRA